jgi:hypothetical protein
MQSKISKHHVATSIFIIKNKFLLPSFHIPWIIVIVMNYINNKKNSITICFLCCHKYNRWSGRVCFLAYYHNYNKGRLGSFFLVAISTLGGGIYLHFLSWCNDEEEQQFFDKGWNFNVLEFACCTSNLSKGL